MPIADIGRVDRALVVGSFLRKDHPLLAHRLRQAVKRGAQVSSLHSVDDNWLLPIAPRATVLP
jgi:NADH-quinone oxidoreductase subunit G